MESRQNWILEISCSILSFAALLVVVYARLGRETRDCNAAVRKEEGNAVIDTTS